MGDRDPLPARSTGAGPRVVLVHGFTQTGRSWAPLVGPLAADHEVVTVDAPGHGQAAGRGHLDLWAGAAALGAAGGVAAYVGYSMGGRLALHLALAHPNLVERLVLVSATAGIDDPEERGARRRADEELARRLETEPLEAFLDRWQAQPLFAGLSPDPSDRAARLANTTAGLAASLRHAGTGTMDPPLWDRLAEVGAAGIPVLVVTGAEDPKFTALGERLVAAIGGPARQVVVPGAGHAVPWERPDALERALRAFLAA